MGVNDIPLGDYEKGQLLAQILGEKATVLVLDGVEPLQHGPQGKLGGMFKDQGLAGLLVELAREPGQCRCLVSSRVHLADNGLRAKAGRLIQQFDLNHLSPMASVELLRSRGVNGRYLDLEQTAAHYDYHALALVLVGEYLHTFHYGRVERALEIPLIADKTKAGRHAMSVMKAYDLALKKEGEELDREMVRMLGLFDRPAEPAVMAALKNAVPIHGLTTLYSKATPMEVEESLARLRQWGLLNTGLDLDAHPLVREWFGEALQRGAPAAFRQAHVLLFRYYQKIPKTKQPYTLEELEPLYRAVRHGCLAEKYHECYLLYQDRIQQRNRYYSTRVLGAYSSDLSAIGSFFPDGFERYPVARLPVTARSVLVATASFLLMSIGRLNEAIEPQKVSMRMDEKASDWANASRSAQNLTNIFLLLGRLSEAWEAARQGVGFALKVDNRLIEEKDSHASLGRVAHMQGRIEDAKSAFQQAKNLESLCNNVGEYYSIQGFINDIFLIEQAGTIKERTEILDNEIYHKVSLYDNRQKTAFCQLITGIVMASLDDVREALSDLRLAVMNIRLAGTNNYLPMILLSHAQVLHRHGDLVQAKKQLNEAQEIAERGEMRLYLADGLLLAGQIALDEGREAKEDYQKAEQLINDMGYERRRGELMLLKARIQKSQKLLEEAFDQFRKLGQLGLLDWYKNTQV
ncbi:MAG: hypothetical protein HQL55_17885 [Magnetococcales bacterium]|nr:hypothetical protein [Magnetococcales bacterium]